MLKVDVLRFIVDEALILVPVLYIIGSLLKAIPGLSNWLIPWILLVLGVLCCFFYLGFSFESLFQGILVAGTTVYCNQLFQQTRNRNN